MEAWLTLPPTKTSYNFTKTRSNYIRKRKKKIKMKIKVIRSLILLQSIKGVVGKGERENKHYSRNKEAVSI